MKTFKEILEQTNWFGVKEQLLINYPHQKENLVGYEDVYNKLFTLKSLDNHDNCTIIMDLKYDDDNSYYVVLGLVNKKKYAIGYCSWEEWLGFYVDEKLLTERSSEEIVAHCLYEMTWGGFAQED